MTAPDNFCRFASCTFMRPCSTTSQRCSVGFRSGDWEGHWRTLNSLSCSWNMIDYFCFVTWCIIMLEVTIRRWVHCGHEGIHMLSNNSNRLWHSSDDWFVLTGLNCGNKAFPTPLHHRHQLGLFTQGREGPWIHAVAAKFWPYYLQASTEIEIHRARLCFFSLTVQFWWACTHCSLSFLFLADRSGTRHGLLLL